MAAPTHEGKKVASPDHTEGTGRPNKLLIKDYAETRGGSFRVETDVDLSIDEFKQLRGWLDAPGSTNTKTIVAFLHKKVDDQNKPGKENAKRMFSAAFDLTA